MLHSTFFIERELSYFLLNLCLTISCFYQEFNNVQLFFYIL